MPNVSSLTLCVYDLKAREVVLVVEEPLIIQFQTLAMPNLSVSQPTHTKHPMRVHELSRNGQLVCGKHETERRCWAGSRSPSCGSRPNLPPKLTIPSRLMAQRTHFGFAAYPPKNTSTAYLIRQVADHKALQLLVAETCAIP